MKAIITFTFFAITDGKVSLWLWKSLENLGFFLLLCGHPVAFSVWQHHWTRQRFCILRQMLLRM